MQVYPNPFVESATLKLNLQNKQNVCITLYDQLGNTVGILQNGLMGSGEYKYDIKGRSLLPGIYFISVKGETFIDYKKIILSKY